MIYLDNAATTKPCDEAKAAVMKGLEVFEPLLCTEQVLTLSFLFLTLVRSLPTLSVLPLMRSISLRVLLKATIPLFSGAYKAHGKRKKRVVISHSVEHPAARKILPRSLKIWAVRS